MAQAKKSSTTRAAVWIIVGLLMFSMIGFGAAGLSGTASSLGTVGDKTLSVNSYQSALQGEISNIQQRIQRPLTASEIQNAGIDGQVLAQVIALRALDQKATDWGLSIGDDRVRDQVLSVPAFSGLDGVFDAVAYRELLSRNGTSAQEFETRLREEAARGILQASVLSGIEASDVYADTIVGFLTETRDFTWAKITADQLITGVAIPTEADLRTYHTENADEFTSPEAKRITLAWINPDMIFDTITVADADVAALYDSRSAEYNQPEARIVERLIFPDTAQAQTAVDAINAGSKTFEDAIADRGLTSADVDLGDITRRDLDAEGDAVFAIAEPGLVGPVDTDLGPAVFRVTAILDAQIRSLDDVRSELVAELTMQQAVDVIQTQIENIDDLLAGGATLEDVAAETEMTLATLDWHAGTAGGIADYEEFQQAAAAVSGEDFPELAQLSDGGLFALRLDEVVPATLQEFDVVKSEVESAWIDAETQKEVRALAENLMGQVSDTVGMASLGLTEQAEEDVTRTEFVENTPPALVSTAFEMVAGETQLVEDVDGVIIVRLGKIHTADLDDPESETLRSIIRQGLTQDLHTEIFNAFAEGVRQDVDVSINQPLVQAVVSSVVSANGGL